ncbi:hypothetical protein [Sphingomicrobium sediminis]|uniref:Uncharacterized protein n=1 Tax=Sphingomicrobium sediminis TaxID=2950949 RepID=A0A9X2J4E2_9SPHN|nr:hypothetical protein [Sphingomicrobium sediminis]MCM8557127.1 hypothetical protein [Sphingomicrobium sediminis]
MTKRDENLTGEQREAKRRRRFWKMMAGFALAGFLSAFFAGFFTGFSDGIGSPIALIVFLVCCAAFYTWISAYFFRTVDELEVADNLWGSLIGLYFYLGAQPAWWVLHDAGVVGPIEHWPLYIATVFVAMAAYVGRKILNR